MRFRSTTAQARFVFYGIFLFLFISACATNDSGERDWVHPVYREKIKEWQTRIQREGWSEGQVHSVLLQFRGLAAYRVEISDHWDTPKEFLRKGFQGDCKNIAIYEMAVLKQLGYPHGIRILIVHALFEDHALLKVEMPEGGWKVYDVVPEGVPTPRQDLIKPVAEFDEKMVSWFPQRVPVQADGRRLGPAAPSPDGWR